MRYDNSNMTRNTKASPYYYSYGASQPHAVSGIDALPGTVPAAQCDITYNSRNHPATISEDGWTLQLAYGDGLQRESVTLLHDLANVGVTHFISGDCEREIRLAGSRYLDYIRADGRTVAVHVRNGTADSIYYVQTDLLGSWERVVDENRNVVQSSRFDPWGNRMEANDWTAGQDGTPLPFHRGFTGHEHYDRFGIINMNARLYDPVIGRFFSPDPQVQNPFSTQGLNRYSYCGNNPVMYIDEDGEFAWIPILITTAIGIYSGGVLANNGEYNPFRWDYSSGKTWGYMAAGGIVGFFSGYIGNIIATSQIPMANTLSLMASSLINSVGTSIYTGGQTPVSINFGFGSYDFTNNKWGFLFKKGNEWYENLGYGLGSLAILADINLLINRTNATLYTEKKDIISHTAVEDENGNVLMSYGPDPNDAKRPNTLLGFAFRFRKSMSNFPVYKELPLNITINKYIFSLMRTVGNYLPYQGISINCVNMVSLSLWLNGIPNLVYTHIYYIYLC